MNYYDYVDYTEDELGIPCHPLVDQCNARIIYRLLEATGFEEIDRTALDLGTGSGQIARLLKGIPSLKVEALDKDPVSMKNFSINPELKNLQFHKLDFLESPLPKSFDIIIARGVYHHIPKNKRSFFLKKIQAKCKILIIADEGIHEYQSDKERKANCQIWYSYVIKESERRGLFSLAKNEKKFLKQEMKSSADEGLDFKESPACFLEDALKVNMIPKSMDRVGNWDKTKGGFFIATFLNNN